MFIRKLFFGIMPILLSLNLALCEVPKNQKDFDAKLSDCLNLIHSYYDQNLISTEQNDELTKIKRITSGVFLSSLSVPKEVKSDSYDLGLEDKIKEILKSGSPIQKEAALHFISYMIFNYESEYGSDNVYFNLIWKIFSDEWRREAFFNLCVQTFTSAPDVEINICKAYYDLFCLYIFTDNRSVTSDVLNKIIETGFKKEDFFIQACVQMLKFYANKAKGNYKEDFDFFKKDTLIKTQEIFFNKFVLKKTTYSGNYRLNDVIENIRSGLFDEQNKQIVEKKIKRFKNKSSFNAFINLCNTAIDNNVGIKNIIAILDKVTLESCNYDFNKDLLKVCTRLTKHPDFFDTGLKFLQEYNEMGGLFSYGDEYYHFCSKLICNNLERFCTLEKIHEYAKNNSQHNKQLESFIIGVIYYEGIIDAGNNNAMEEYTKVIRYIRKNSENNARDVFGYGLESFYNCTNPMQRIHFQINGKNKKVLSKDSFLLGMLFSKVYLYQNAIYNFLDIAYIWGVFISSGATSKNTIEFIDTIRNERPMFYEDIIADDCRHRDQRIYDDYLKGLEIENKRLTTCNENKGSAFNTGDVTCGLCDIDLTNL